MEDKITLQELREHPAWKLLEQYMKDQQNYLTGKLVKIAPNESVEIANIQGQLQAFDKIINKVNK